MRVLIVGGGGREHALAACLSRSPALARLFVAPGNPGTAQVADNVAIAADDIPGLLAFARAERIELVVPGPEAPLVAGLADALAGAGIACCGPTARAARLESSKAFAKEICDAAGIPTARWERFENAEAARDFVRRRGAPVVIKADGLAAGKGVTVAETEAEAEAALATLPAGPVVVEERLAGPEVSLFALCDGERAVVLGAARDHKRAFDHDRGPNTGGMGAVSPPPGFSREAELAACDIFVRPVLAALAAAGTPFRGFLFAGLMLTESGPKLIEYNARLGDPEAQALLPRLRTDLLPLMCDAASGSLDETTAVESEGHAIAVVLAAQGYPGEFARGEAIGIEAAGAVAGASIFHAGTALQEKRLVSAGGRVLAVSALADTPDEARETAYRAVAAIDWPGGFCRRDIGAARP